MALYIIDNVRIDSNEKFYSKIYIYIYIKKYLKT